MGSGWLVTDASGGVCSLGDLFSAAPPAVPHPDLTCLSPWASLAGSLLVAALVELVAQRRLVAQEPLWVIWSRLAAYIAGALGSVAAANGLSSGIPASARVVLPVVMAFGVGAAGMLGARFFHDLLVAVVKGRRRRARPRVSRAAAGPPASIESQATQAVKPES